MSAKKKSPGRGDHPVRQFAVFFHNTALQISALWLFRAGADGEKRITDDDWWLDQRSKLLPEVLRMGQLARGIHRHFTSAFRRLLEFESKVVALLNDLRDYCVSGQRYTNASSRRRMQSGSTPTIATMFGRLR